MNAGADDTHEKNPESHEHPEGHEQQKPKLEISSSRRFTSWLGEQNISLVFTTYQIGKVFFIGLDPHQGISIFERTLPRCMGAASNGQKLYLSSLYQLVGFVNALPENENHKGYDRLYIPQFSYITGDIDVHDVAIDKEGKPIFVNTLFSCLARPSDTHSFKPIWKPHFITKLAAEDRCHLNGLATEDGEPRYVTAVSESDINEGWREHRPDGGIVMDVEKNQVVVSGLAMPHSPRLYDGKLWLRCLVGLRCGFGCFLCGGIGGGIR